MSDFSGVRKKFLTSCCVMRAAADEILLLAAQVRDDRADRADQIDAGVVVEPAVLDGQHRLHHARRDRRQAAPAGASRGPC